MRTESRICVVMVLNNDGGLLLCAASGSASLPDLKYRGLFRLTDRQTDKAQQRRFEPYKFGSPRRKKNKKSCAFFFHLSISLFDKPLFFLLFFYF